MRDLISTAAEYGLRIHASRLPGDVLGLYSPAESRIYFDLSLTPNERRVVIAHELGHAFFGHDSDSPANERLADTYAAEMLINPVEYAELERISCDPHYLAEELNITADLVIHYQGACLQRLGSRTYATKHRSRLSARLARTLSLEPHGHDQSLRDQGR